MTDSQRFRFELDLNMKAEDPKINAEIRVGIPFLGFENILKVDRFFASLPCQILEPKNGDVILNDLLIMSEFDDEQHLQTQRYFCTEFLCSTIVCRPSHEKAFIQAYKELKLVIDASLLSFDTTKTPIQ